MLSYYEEIYKKLKSEGIEIYAPSQKNDLCKNRYVVIKEDGQYTRNKLTGYSIITLYCYIPKNIYSKLEYFVDEIENELSNIDFLVKTGNKSPKIYDDDVQGYFQTIEYYVYHKIK